MLADLPVEIDDDLREIDFGRWENRRFEEVSAAEPELVGRWAAFAPTSSFPAARAWPVSSSGSRRRPTAWRQTMSIRCWPSPTGA